MDLPTNNIAPTLVGFALLVVLAPVLLLLVYVIRSGLLGARPHAWLLKMLNGRSRSDADQKGFWAFLDDVSHARLL
jgi:hypothetical protein